MTNTTELPIAFPSRVGPISWLFVKRVSVDTALMRQSKAAWLELSDSERAEVRAAVASMREHMETDS